MAGSDFTIALTQRGTVYAFGNGDYTGTYWWGRGWEGASQKLLLPRRIVALDEARVDLLAAGSAHAMLRTSCGALYTFGSGEQGQLGHGDLCEQLLPKKVQALDVLEAAPATPSVAPTSPEVP